MREGDGHSIPVLPSKRVLEECGQFYPKKKALHKEELECDMIASIVKLLVVELRALIRNMFNQILRSKDFLKRRN